MSKTVGISILAAIGVWASSLCPIAAADPVILSDPTYCTGTNFGPEAGPRQDGKDTVQATTDIRCDQNQTVEVIYTISGDGHTWTDDIEGFVTSSGRLFTSNNHKVGGDLNGQVYTVKTTVKVFASGFILCGGPDANHCYPNGTPLRTFDLPDVSAPVYD
jgi:hypothetical protein